MFLEFGGQGFELMRPKRIDLAIITRKKGLVRLEHPVDPDDEHVCRKFTHQKVW